MTGAWKLADMTACNLPEDVATGFDMALGTLDGASYIPVLYCGTQLVHGTNHMLICKQTLVVQHPQEHLVKVILNQPLPQETNSVWSVISIETIL